MGLTSGGRADPLDLLPNLVDLGKVVSKAETEERALQVVSVGWLGRGRGRVQGISQARVFTNLAESGSSAVLKAWVNQACQAAPISTTRAPHRSITGQALVLLRVSSWRGVGQAGSSPR